MSRVPACRTGSEWPAAPAVCDLSPTQRAKRAKALPKLLPVLLTSRAQERLLFSPFCCSGF